MPTSEVKPDERVVFGPMPYAAKLQIPDLFPQDESPLEGEGLETILAEEQEGTADTQGWDTVFAIRLTDVNRTLEKPGVSPESWSIDLSQNYQGSGTFGPWQAAQGGSAAILRMSAPLKTGSVTFDQETYELGGGTVYFQVELIYIPQADADSSKGNNDLKVKTTPTVQEVPVVVVDSVDFGPNPEPSAMAKALVKGALEEWFNKNIALFQHVFSTVNLAAQADKEAFQWLMPTYTSYAYLDGATMDTSFFGVLCMCQNHDPGTNPPQLSPGAIPPEARAGFSIAQHEVMRQMVLPAVVTGFSHADASYLELTNHEQAIRNTKNIPLDSVRVGAIDYHPEVEEFDLQVNGELLQIHSKVHVNISAGIDAYMETTSYKKIALTSQGSGSNTLAFVDARPPEQNHWTEVSNGIVITEVVIGIIGAILGSVMAALGATAGWIVAAIIVAILFGIAAAVPTLIKQFVGGKAIDKLPSIDDLVLSPSTAINWPAGGIFSVTSVVLNEALVLGGEPHFA